MSLGIRITLCTIITLLTMIAERGAPIKLQSYDKLIYLIEWLAIFFITLITDAISF